MFNDIKSYLDSGVFFCRFNLKFLKETNDFHLLGRGRVEVQAGVSLILVLILIVSIKLRSLFDTLIFGAVFRGNVFTSIFY